MGKAPAKSSANMKGSDLLAMAAAVASPSSKEAKGKEPRLVLELDATEQAWLNQLVNAKELGKICEVKEDEVDKMLKDRILSKFVQIFWKNQAVPSNPELMTYCDPDKKSVNNRIIFQVKAIFRPAKSLPPMKDREEGKSTYDYLIEALTTGTYAIGEETAAKILDSEVKIAQSVSLRNLNELLEGSMVDRVWTPATPAQQAVATKLLQLIFANSNRGLTDIGTFTNEDRALLLEQDGETIKIKDPKNFLSSLMHYAKTEGQLGHLIQVFRPDLSWSSATFAMSATPADNPRLEAAKAILGLDKS